MMTRNWRVAMFKWQTEIDPVLYGILILCSARKERREAERDNDPKSRKDTISERIGYLEAVSEHDLDAVCGLTPEQLTPIQAKIDAAASAVEVAREALRELMIEQAVADGLDPMHIINRVRNSKTLWR